MSDIRDVTVGTGAGKEVEYSWRQAGVQVLRCHSGAVKRITTEDSPALFLTVSEVTISSYLCGFFTKISFRMVQSDSMIYVQHTIVCPDRALRHS